MHHHRQMTSQLQKCVEGSHRADPIMMTTIDARGKTISRIPLNFNTFLPNINRIFFEKGLKEIHKEDLAQFPKLIWLYLSFNDIKVIEPDLLIHNPHLKLVFIGENKIHTVAPNVFDGLTELSYLGFDRNNCHDGHVENDRQGADELIRDIYKNCAPISETGKCEAKVDKIVKEFQALTSELREWKKEMTNYCKLKKKSCDIDQ